MKYFLFIFLPVLFVSSFSQATPSLFYHDEKFKVLDEDNGATFSCE